MSKHCPNCVTEMVKQKRSLGRKSKTPWYVCPSCGVRELQVKPHISQSEIKARIRQRKRDERGYYDEEGHNTY